MVIICNYIIGFWLCVDEALFHWQSKNFGWLKSHPCKVSCTGDISGTHKSAVWLSNNNHKDPNDTNANCFGLSRLPAIVFTFHMHNLFNKSLIKMKCTYHLVHRRVWLRAPGSLLVPHVEWWPQLPRAPWKRRSGTTNVSSGQPVNKT